MNIIISTSKITAKMELKNNSKSVDILEWKNDYNLSRLLLFNLDKLLKKHNLKLSDIEKFEFKNEEDTGFTTSRIAETTVNILNFANKN